MIAFSIAVLSLISVKFYFVLVLGARAAGHVNDVTLGDEPKCAKVSTQLSRQS
jgi:hypothetical protein